MRHGRPSFRLYPSELWIGRRRHHREVCRLRKESGLVLVWDPCGVDGKLVGRLGWARTIHGDLMNDIDGLLGRWFVGVRSLRSRTGVQVEPKVLIPGLRLSNKLCLLCLRLVEEVEIRIHSWGREAKNDLAFSDASPRTAPK
nr:hypothetical protein Iba_chr04dCG12270 [Ipomoea batatas]